VSATSRPFCASEEAACLTDGKRDYLNNW
jgi:hypothetical protein